MKLLRYGLPGAEKPGLLEGGRAKMRNRVQSVIETHKQEIGTDRVNAMHAVVAKVRGR